MKKNKGITLIALVITIIVLLILAGVSIATLTGQNGILSKATTAEEESKKAQYKEALQIIGNGLRDEKILENLTVEEYMERYKEAIEEEISRKGTLEGARVVVKNPTTLRVITKEGYVYEITEDEVRYIGEQGKNPPPNLQEGDIAFKLNPSGYTNTNVTVEITVNIDIGKNMIQYSKDGTTWEKYSTAVTFEKNETIYARLINELDEIGGTATKPIDKIDKEDPNQATISFSPASIDTDTEITATVTQSDNGVSGVDMTKCKWVYTDSSTSLEKNEAKFTGGFFKENQTEIKAKITTPGTYYLHILTVDKAKNKTETVKGPITVKKAMAKVGEIVTGENKEYEKNGTAIIPVGFAIKPGCDDISKGLVISDVANDTEDTGNQFVWIAVADTVNYTNNVGKYPIYYTDVHTTGTVDYLPSGVTDEKTTVISAGGFYIARFETGTGLVSKKGIWPWTNITQADANSQAKNFIQNAHVKSALVSGVQWDLVMDFVNGKKDGTGQPFYTNTPSTTRHIGGANKGIRNSGSNAADFVCNIYDLEGNCTEYSIETGSNGTFPYGYSRGGCTEYYSEGWYRNMASVRWTATYGDKSWSHSFRMVLYVMK